MCSNYRFAICGETALTTHCSREFDTREGRPRFEPSLSSRPSFVGGGAVHRPAALPRLAPFRAAEWVVAQVSPFPTRDAFSIDDSSRNTSRGFDVASSHGTRSHDRGTRAEWNQSPAPRRLSAKGIVAWTALPGCPCLALVLETHRRKSH